MISNITFELLNKYYNINKKSVLEISKKLKCSQGRVNYWLDRYRIEKRSISEAIYIKNNPKGDPFKFTSPKNIEEAKLFGLGLGLYWGEGNKANKNTVRIGNSDPALLRRFIEFLEKFFKINKTDLKFHLHIFTDIDLNEAKSFWIRELRIKESQMYKPTITKSGSLGTYRNKSKYGVLTIYYGNTKLRDTIIRMLPL
jgi:hypothetical protein